MAETIRAALERLLAVVKPTYTDPDEIVAAAYAVGAARAALMADGPAVQSREPASVVGEPSDEELDACADELLDWNPEGARAFARAVLARWGHQPAPPVAVEVGELVAWLRAWALGTMEEGQPATSRSLTRAADLLEQRHPEPVPVSERLPQPEDCDELGRCWAWDWPEEAWVLCDRTCAANGFTHWLPATALPLPAGEVGHG